MAIIINGKTYRNLEEQVEYNKDKIEELGDVEVEVAAIKEKTDLIDVDEDTMTINDGLDVKDNGDVTVGHDLSIEGVVNVGNVVLSDNGETLEIDGVEIATEDDIDTVMAVAEGKSKAYVVNLSDNPSFNSQDALIKVSGTTTFTDTSGNTFGIDDLKIGDIIYIVETDKPDRWYAGIEEYPSTKMLFRILETASVDLSNYATKGTNTFTGTQTFYDSSDPSHAYYATVGHQLIAFFNQNDSDSSRLYANRLQITDGILGTTTYKVGKIVNDGDEILLPAESGTLELSGKNTIQTTAPTSAIYDGGIHIVVLEDEPQTKYDGYIYLIEEA